MNTQQLLVVLPYHTGDVTQARALLNWIAKISPKLGPHCCLLAADSMVPHETKIELGNLAKTIFYSAETAIINVPAEATGWPKAANAMFRITSKHIQECFKMPFFWMEPDCIPLKPSWLDELAVQYSRCPKRIMGALIHSKQPPMPPVHLAGCAVYPADIGAAMLPYTETDMAFDIASAGYAVPRAMGTNLIHHVWGEPNLPPIFKDEKLAGDSVNTCTFDFLKEGACVFHRSKDSTLIDLLERRMHNELLATDKSTVDIIPVHRGPGRPKKNQNAIPVST